jgi:adenylosuccinate lyase
MILLGKALGRDVAHRILEEATRQSIAQQKHLAEVLAEVLAEMPEVAHLDPAAIRGLEDPEQYLGVAETLRKQLLAFPGQQTSKAERK